MFVKSVIALAAVAGSVSAAPVEARASKVAPSGWATDYLEPYMTYHIRYLALQCYTKKNTDFFNSCCRPMLATETLETARAAECIPSDEALSSVSSSLSVKYGSTATGSAAEAAATSDAEADGETYPTTVTDWASAYAAETSSAAAASSASAAAASSTTEEAAPASSTTAVGVQYQAEAASSTTSEAAPTTTSTSTWSPEPTTSEAAATSSAASSGSSGSYSGGYATYFYQGGVAGACGSVNSDSALIVAIDHEQWGDQSFSTGSSTCGRSVYITNTNNGKSVTATIADVCPTCANANSLDLSVGAFQAIADLSDGMVPITWSWA